MIDVFHFNSSVSQKQFEKHLYVAAKQVVLPITHRGIADNRAIKDFSASVLKVGFIGSETPYKGLPVLKQTLSKIDSRCWRLDVWGGRTEVSADSPIRFRGKFNKSMISKVYGEMDLLVVPSIWQETFSLVTLEALSYGVPVLVSKNVGAKDVVREYDDYFIYNTVDELEQKIRYLIIDKNRLKIFNQKIMQKSWKHDVFEHAKNVVEKLYNLG